MKERVSVTVEKDILAILNELAKARKYRNRSHVVECAIEALQEREGEKHGRT